LPVGEGGFGADSTFAAGTTRIGFTTAGTAGATGMGGACTRSDARSSVEAGVAASEVKAAAVRVGLAEDAKPDGGSHIHDCLAKPPQTFRRGQRYGAQTTRAQPTSHVYTDSAGSGKKSTKPPFQGYASPSSGSRGLADRSLSQSVGRGPLYGRATGLAPGRIRFRIRIGPVDRQPVRSVERVSGRSEKKPGRQDPRGRLRKREGSIPSLGTRYEAD
jgi:hypothetical protein